MGKYYYGVGRVRALEARMLSAAQLSRLVGAPDFESAFAVLPETAYAENLTKLTHPFDFEELCELELISLKNLLDYLAPRNEIIAAIFKKYDYLNAKILLRLYFKEIEKIVSWHEPAECKFSKVGIYDLEKIRSYIFEGIKEIDDKNLLEAIDQAKNSYAQNKDPQSLDIILDKYYFAYLKEACGPSPSPLIKNMVRSKIDLINLKSLLRTQELKKLEKVLLKGGFIDKDILLESYGKNVPDIILRLSFTPYFPAMVQGVEEFSKTKSFHLLEKLMDDFMINQFRKAKYLTSGLEPLVGFYLAKESEIKTLRFILICKKNYIESERIKERIRASYV